MKHSTKSRTKTPARAKVWGCIGGLLLAGNACAEIRSIDQNGVTTNLLAQGRTDEAMRVLESQVGANPFDPVAMNNLAAMEASRNGWNAAATLLVRAHKLAPDNTIISNNLDQLNAWLSRSTAASSDTMASATKNDRLNELAQIPPEPPELWEKTPAAVSAPAAESDSSTARRHKLKQDSR